MQTLRASKLGLNPTLLSPAILDILTTLTEAGFEAYIVGGGVRDLLLGLHPKDFDAVTNATPSQIKSVFGKRCRIIGRRFELAHVYSGRDMIEVATFRAPPHRPNTTASGMVTRDNVWGNIEQDFVRRDFTINALYYQPMKGQVLDFCHALTDIRDKKIRFLGQPIQRFEEDPVRMLRVLRFAAKLKFQMDASIRQALTPKLAERLLEVSPHRLYDETQKMFSGGYLTPLLPLMLEHHVWPMLLADVAPVLTAFIQRAAENTDVRIASGKSINPAFFYAVLLWQPFLQRVQQLEGQGLASHDAWTQAGVDVLRRQQRHTAIPRYAEMFIREIWELQPRLIQPKARQIPSLVTLPRFRAAFDFLYLREQVADGQTEGMGQWWHDYQALDNDQREQAIRLFNRQQLRQRRQQPIAVLATSERVVAIDPNATLADLAIQAEATLESRSARRRRVRREKAQANVRETQNARRVAVLATEVEPTDALMTTGMKPNVHTRAPHGSQDSNLPRRRRRPRDLSQVFMGPY
ncbi:MAG: polynucleotide adenylyltransferase PcnB [Pseudomonadota bacterium]|nr:polynucleotide adenylyltransferase PcnB [Pseudomonadota bacterium]